MPDAKVVLDSDDMRRTLVRIAHEIVENDGEPERLALVGIHRRGAVLAAPPAASCSPSCSTSTSRSATSTSPSTATTSRTRGGAPVVHATHLDFDVDGRTIVIVDDVLFTGRTVRAAIEALFDYGRPARVQLAVLADRGHRELPFRPDYVGKNLPTAAQRARQRARRGARRRRQVAIARAPRRSPHEAPALASRTSRATTSSASSTAPPRSSEVADRDIKKVPALRGRTVLNLFYEASHAHALVLRARGQAAERRRRELRGQRLERREGRVAEGHRPDARPRTRPTRSSSARRRRAPPTLVAGWTTAAIVNAGDGKHEHPTQALLDVYTLRQKLGSLDGRNIWIVGDVAHSRVARSNILAFRKMGAHVTRLRPADAHPARHRGARLRRALRPRRPARGRRRLRAADAERAHGRRRSSRRCASTPRATRSTAAGSARARCSCTPARSTAASSCPARSSTRRRRSSRCRSRPASSCGWRSSTRCSPARATTAPGRPRADRAAARMSAARASRATARRAPATRARPRARPARRPARPRRARARPAHGPRRACTTCSSATARSPRSARPAARRATAGVETIDGAGRHLFPAFVDPHVHLRTPGQEHKEDLETGTRAAAAGGFCAIVAMPNTVAGRRLRADPRRAARRRRARGARPRRLHAGDHARPGRRASSPRWPSCATLGAVGFTDDGRPVVDAGVLRRALQYQRLCGGVLALHEEDPALSGKGAMHEGAVSARARRRRDPERQRVDDDRPRLRARRLRGRADPHPAPLGARVGRGDRGREGARRAGHVRGQPAPPDADRRGRPRPRHAHEDEPAAARRGRPPGAHRGPARRDRSTASRPTTRRTRATRRRSRSSRRRWARPAWRRRSRRSTPTSSCPATLDARARRREADGRPRPARPARAATIAVGEPANLVLVDLDAEWVVGETGYESRSENCCFAGPRRCAGEVLLTVAAGAVAYRERAIMLAAAPRQREPPSAYVLLEDGTRFDGDRLRRAGGRDRRGRLHDRHVRLPGVGDRPELRRPDHHVHLPAHRQLRRVARRRWSPTASGPAR